jgi:hypothetical protein
MVPQLPPSGIRLIEAEYFDRYVDREDRIAQHQYRLCPNRELKIKSISYPLFVTLGRRK